MIFIIWSHATHPYKLSTKMLSHSFWCSCILLDPSSHISPFRLWYNQSSTLKLTSTMFITHLFGPTGHVNTRKGFSLCFLPTQYILISPTPSSVHTTDPFTWEDIHLFPKKFSLTWHLSLHNAVFAHHAIDISTTHIGYPLGHLWLLIQVTGSTITLRLVVDLRGYWLHGAATIT